MGFFSRKAPVQQNAVNDLIFRELIKRGYSLEGNTRVWNIADSKLWYLTPSQAQAFLDLEKSEDYQKNVIQAEIDLINKNIKEIIQKCGNEPVNIIDLGCGDGKKALLFIKHLMGKIKFRYCPIDISSYMVQKALETIRSLGIEDVVEFKWNISDFENLENISSLLRQGEFRKNFIMLLGNTLGNFEINELLYEIRSSMKEGDVLLIGNGLNTQNAEDILKSYNNKEVDNFLCKIPLQVGLSQESVRLGARFRNSRVELYYTILADREIIFQGKRIVFNKGDQIIIAVSYKYEKNDFIAFMKMYFDDVKIFFTQNNSYALVLCKK
jgi:uncharacterized SAM-dependent methyltransferase